MRVITASLLFFSPIYSVRLTQKKLCRDCKHFIGNSEKCAIFGEPDLVNGKPDHEYASISRRKECGEDATYFEENKMKFITGPVYSFLGYWPFYILFMLYGTFIYASYVIIHN